MGAYLLRRVVAMIPTLLGITFVTFLIMNLAPGDPVSAQFQQAGVPGEEGSAANRDRLADTIKAKKKLLGIVTEDHSVLRWQARVSADPAATAQSLHLGVRAGASSGWPQALALAPDGSVVYSGWEDHLVRVFDARTGSEVRRLGGHAASIWALAASSDGARLASADTAGVVKAWDARSGALLWSAQPSEQLVHDLAYLPDGRLLAALDDGTVRVLGPLGEETGRLGGAVASVNAVVVSRDGTRAWTGGYDRKVREWDLTAPGAEPLVLAELGQVVNDLALSPDGTWLACACEDRTVRRVPVGSVSSAEPAEIARHYRGVDAVALSPDGRTLWTGGADEMIGGWDLASGKLVAQTRVALGKVHAVALSPDGATLWSASDSWRTVAIPRRYLSWMSRMARFDFDRSFKDDRKVIDKIRDALPVTLGLNALSLGLIYIVAIPIGILAAARRGGTFDHVSSFAVFALFSIPNFWLATLLILSFSSKTSWDVLPSVGLHDAYAPDFSYLAWLGDWGLHLVLPIICLSYAGFAGLSRYARTSMLEAIGQDYVRTARAKGLSERVVLYRHAFRNSLVTIVTLVANLLPAMIGGSVIIEQIFSIDGMGKLGFDAILARDYPVIMAITTFSALLTLAGILVADVLYSVVDPRISHS